MARCSAPVRAQSAILCHHNKTMSKRVKQDLTHHPLGMRVLARLCERSTLPPSLYEKYSVLALNFDLVVFVESLATDTQVYLARRGKHCAIVFRGSTTARDVLTDLQVDLVEWETGMARVHHGMHTAWESIKHQVMAALGRVGYFESITCTGCGLGGGLAMLAAHHISAPMHAQNVHCITFGAPRVGDRSFARSLESSRAKVVRFEWRGDPIIKLPPCQIGYEHAGIQYRLRFPGLLHCLLACAARPRPGDITDNRMLAYVNAIDHVFGRASG